MPVTPHVTRHVAADSQPSNAMHASATCAHSPPGSTAHMAHAAHCMSAQLCGSPLSVDGSVELVGSGPLLLVDGSPLVSELVSLEPTLDSALVGSALPESADVDVVPLLEASAPDVGMSCHVAPPIVVDDDEPSLVSVPPPLGVVPHAVSSTHAIRLIRMSPPAR